ncbi:MAG: hypothetical protein LC792_22495 [Actinobacteria bacterium]|nr:hypothetical protein [Actinomycetota bacterium]
MLTGETSVPTSGQTIVLSLNVPAGSYTITASFDAENDGGTDVTGNCDAGTGAALNFTVPPHSILPVPLTQAWINGSVPPIPLRCLAFLGPYSVSNAWMTATAVGSLHVSYQAGTAG